MSILHPSLHQITSRPQVSGTETDGKTCVSVRPVSIVSFFLRVEDGTQCRTAQSTRGAQPGPPSLTPHGPDGVAQSIAQDPLLLVVQDKHAVHRELLGAGQGRPGVVMDTLLEGDGLAPLVGVDVRRGSAVVLGVSHGVLPGGGGCDHWGAGRQEGDKGGRQRRERKDASGFAGGFKTMGSIRRPQRGQRESG